MYHDDDASCSPLFADILCIVNTVAFCLSLITAWLFWFTDAYNQMLLQVRKRRTARDVIDN
jgi:hypothetical protein